VPPTVLRMLLSTASLSLSAILYRKSSGVQTSDSILFLLRLAWVLLDENECAEDGEGCLSGLRNAVSVFCGTFPPIAMLVFELHPV
jgi:hypothetical protein